MARNRRLFVDSGLTPERLQPVANPVDTFVRTNAGSGLSQLAQSLSAIAPQLARLSDVRASQENDKETAAGEKKARELHEARVTFNDAIKKGLIDPHQSPFFMAGFKQQFGRVVAGDYDAALRVAMQSDPGLQQSTDLADFDAFESKYRSQWLSENVGEKNRDTHFEAGFGRMSDGLTMDAKRQFSQAVAQRVTVAAGDNLYREMSQVLDIGYKRGQDATSVVDQINAVSKAYLGINPKGGKIANQMAVRAVVDYAVKNEDETALNLFDQLDAGPGSKLGKTQEAREAFSKAREQIRNSRQNRYAAEAADERREREAGEKTLYTELTKALSTAPNPMAVDLTPFLNRMVEIDPSPQATETVFKLQQAYNDRGFQGDEGVYNDAVLRVWGEHPGMPGRLTMKQASGLLAERKVTAQQYNGIVNMIQERDRKDKEDAENSGPTKGMAYTFWNRNLETRFADPWNANPADRIQAQNAAAAFRTAWIQQGISSLPKDQQDKAGEALASRVFDLYANDAQRKLQGKVQAGVSQNVHAEAQDRNLERPDFKKRAVITRPQVLQIERELTSGKLAQGHKDLFRYFELDTPEKITDFLINQRRLTAGR